MSLTTSAPVLVVEDDPNIARLLIDYLHADGLSSYSVDNGLVAVEAVRRVPPALILLDVMLPGQDGVAVCRELRKFSDVPIIMLTARVDEIDRLLGLETGADDYVCKPFSPREVIARVKALLRRAEGRLGMPALPWQIDDDQLQIHWRGHQLELTVLEFRMLRLLLRRPGRVYSRAQLLDGLHLHERDVSDRAIDSHVKNLRRKIQAVDATFTSIVSVYGVGYRFDIPDNFA